MKILRVLSVIFIAMFLVVGCKVEKKSMTIVEFSKIDAEIALPEPDIDPERVKLIAEKYGFTAKQYKDFYNKVQKDEKLQQKLGELKLNKTEKE